MLVQLLDDPVSRVLVYTVIEGISAALLGFLVLAFLRKYLVKRNESVKYLLIATTLLFSSVAMNFLAVLIQYMERSGIVVGVGDAVFWFKFGYYQALLTCGMLFFRLANVMFLNKAALMKGFAVSVVAVQMIFLLGVPSLFKYAYEAYNPVTEEYEPTIIFSLLVAAIMLVTALIPSLKIAKMRSRVSDPTMRNTLGFFFTGFIMFLFILIMNFLYIMTNEYVIGHLFGLAAWFLMPIGIFSLYKGTFPKKSEAAGQ